MDAADAQGLGAVAEPQGDPTDTLSAVLEAVHLTGAVFFLVEGAAPWVAEAPASTQLAPVILQDAQHIVSYHVITQGSCWCESPGQTPLRLETGDVLVVPHGHAYQLATACGLHTGWSLDETLHWFRAMAGGRLPFVVTEGGGGLERLRLVCGFSAAMHCRSTRCWRHYRCWCECVSMVSRALGCTRSSSSRLLSPLDARAGSRSVLRRIAELVFVEVLRSR